MDDGALETLLTSIGPRVRARRVARGWSLRELAEATGLSVSGLSRLETAVRRPTLDALIPVSIALDVSLDDLIAAPRSGDRRIHLEPRRDRRSRSVVVPLTEYSGRFQVFKQVLAPRPVKLVTHEGHAWLFVLSGRVRVLVEEAESMLGPGEVVEFAATRPHWFGAADDQEVEILHIFGRSGHRVVPGPVR